jgi:hypothetical protein
MASEVGWKHWEAVKTLEEKRKVKGNAYWAKKKELIQVLANPETAPILMSSWVLFLFVAPPPWDLPSHRRTIFPLCSLFSCLEY